MRRLLRLERIVRSTFVAGAVMFTAAAAFGQEAEVSKNVAPSSGSVIFGPAASTGYSPSNLNRVGVQTAQPIPITLNEAILRSLSNNNDIEVSRDDVRFQE